MLHSQRFGCHTCHNFPSHHCISHLQESEAVHKLVGVLDTLWRWVDDIPPASHTLRYGNPAYRTWFAKMEEAAPRVGRAGSGCWLLLARGC